MHFSEPPRARRPRIRALALLAFCAAGSCQWNERWGTSGRLVFGSDGPIGGLTLPGPNPTGVSGIRKDWPAMTEDNIVDITRISGRVQVRLPGDRGLQTLEYTKPTIQTGPGGFLITTPKSAVQLLFSDDSRVIINDTAAARMGDPATDGEPWILCDRLTEIEVTLSHDAKFAGLQLPGGSTIHGTSGARYRVTLERDRYFQIRNEGRVSIELKFAGRSTWIRTADWIDVPVIRNVPEKQQYAEPVRLPDNAVRIGEAAFPNTTVSFDPIIPKQNATQKGNL